MRIVLLTLNLARPSLALVPDTPTGSAVGMSGFWVRQVIIGCFLSVILGKHFHDSFFGFVLGKKTGLSPGWIDLTASRFNPTGPYCARVLDSTGRISLDYLAGRGDPGLNTVPTFRSPWKLAAPLALQRTVKTVLNVSSQARTRGKKINRWKNEISR